MAAEPFNDGEGPWLAGRGAKLLVNDTWIGCFGEIDPAVSSTFDLRVPLNGGEIDVDALNAVVPTRFEDCVMCGRFACLNAD